MDWESFTPLSALTGGLLIGTAVALLLWLNGRVAGVSGIVGGALRPAWDDLGWRVAFVIGLLVGPLLYRLVTAGEVVVVIEAGVPLVVAGGLLVGFGTQLGAGCTSGHGVCGLSRLSPRSLVATLGFMAAGFVTVYVVRHLVGGA